MVNGLPGNMAAITAKHILIEDRFELIPFSLTGPEIEDTRFFIDSTDVLLIQPEKREQAMADIQQNEKSFIIVDYTHPAAANGNAGFYCKQGIPFVMGTTGGDRKFMGKIVRSSSISAVIAPNMAKQIVGFQAMIKWCSDTFPNLFRGYSLEIRESHQSGKADTSGTAKSMIRYFNNLGIPFSETEIIRLRDPGEQKEVLGVPGKYLDGHGWHTYRLTSNDKTVLFEFTHNINGRDIYAAGTLDAVSFLSEKMQEGRQGEIYSMIDVLRGKQLSEDTEIK